MRRWGRNAWGLALPLTGGRIMDNPSTQVSGSLSVRQRMDGILSKVSRVLTWNQQCSFLYGAEAQSVTYRTLHSIEKSQCGPWIRHLYKNKVHRNGTSQGLWPLDPPSRAIQGRQGWGPTGCRVAATWMADCWHHVTWLPSLNFSILSSLFFLPCPLHDLKCCHNHIWAFL